MTDDREMPPSPEKFARAQRKFSKHFETLRRVYFVEIGLYAQKALANVRKRPIEEDELPGAIVSEVHALITESPWANNEALSALVLMFSRHTHAGAIVHSPQTLIVPPEHGGPAISFQLLAISASVEDVLEAIEKLGGLKLGKVEPEQLVRDPKDIWTQPAEPAPPPPSSPPPPPAPPLKPGDVAIPDSLPDGF